MAPSNGQSRKNMDFLSRVMEKTLFNDFLKEIESKELDLEET